MPSSVIRRYDYDVARGTFRIVFVSGEVYLYQGVPPSVAEGLAAAPSRGRYFSSHIRDRYPFRRLTHAPGPPGPDAREPTTRISPRPGR